MSKRDLERKIREEQEATAHAFQEFIETFQISAATQGKTFVKSGVLNPSKGQEDQCQKGQLYIPKTVFKKDPNTIKNAIECARLLKESKIERTKNQEKPKSNLELLKEELKLRHSVREEKNKDKKEEVVCCSAETENGDPHSTNIFVANLSQKVTENDLMQLFGAYGPLASVKIMWPRGDEKGRNTNCGFVAFMSRKDGERALNDLKHREDMRVGWGKCVEIPSNPIYIPPELLKYHLPPPYSGLPFNAQPIKQPYTEPTTEEEMDDLLYNSVIKVTIPLNKRILMVINRTVEFVAREGPLFEAMIMNREIQNPLYQFLFDNKCATHTYYRWKLYSILHGESPKQWSTKKFRMFERGSIWIPPSIPDYSAGMPESLIKNVQKVDKTLLSDSQANRLIQCIQNLSTTRSSIAEAMIFCLNHQEALHEITCILVDSFKNPNTKPMKKMARLYLVSDILYNSNTKKVKKSETSTYQTEIKDHLTEIFENLKTTWKKITKDVDREQFKWRVQKVLRSWDLWKIYQNDYLSKLENVFSPNKTNEDNEEDNFDEPLDGAAFIKRCTENNPDCTLKVEQRPTATKKKDIDFSSFVPSKWERVDPEEVEAQAMSTQKFYEMERKRQSEGTASKNVLSEHERKRLRKVEIMVMEYREEIESGKRKLKKGINIERELDDYRKYLLKKTKKESPLRDQSLSPVSSASSSDDDAKVSRKLKKELQVPKRKGSNNKEREKSSRSSSSRRHSRK